MSPEFHKIPDSTRGNNDSVDRSVANAAASVEMEGYTIDEECRDWCRMVLLNQMSKEDYLHLLLKKAGVTA